MGNGVQRTPDYTPEDLEFINRRRNSRGQLPIDEFGNEIASEEPVVIAPPQPSPPVLNEPGQEAQERAALNELGSAVQDLTQANLQNLVRGSGFKSVPELEDLTYESPDFVDRVGAFARKQALERLKTESGLVPGFPLPGFTTSDDEQVMQFPTTVAGVIPAPSPAPPADIPPLEDPTLATALAPQSRAGETVASTINVRRLEQQRAGLPTPKRYADRQSLDLGIHKDFAELQRIESKAADGLTLNSPEIEELGRLRKKLQGRDIKEQFQDIQDYASYSGLYAALQNYLDKPEIARTRTLEQAIQEVLDEAQELPELMAVPEPIMLPSGPVDPREGDPRFRRHSIGEEDKDPTLFNAFQIHYKAGYVPILSDVQKDFLRASSPVMRQAFVDVLPYQRQVETAENLEAATRAPTFGAAPVVAPPGATSPFAKKPKPISMEEAQANYADRLREAGVQDFYAIDFYDNPEKYAQGFSWWNKSYPSGAAAEGPVQWGLRAVLSPANVSSRLVFEGLRATSPIRSVEGVLGIEDPTVKQRLAAGEDPLYVNHPYLRAIAENRGMMEDFYDLYHYNGYRNIAAAMGGVGLAADVLLSPYDPGVSAAVKGLKTAATARKAAKAVGMSLGPVETAGDFVAGFAKGLSDQTLAGDLLAKKIGRLGQTSRLLDPVEYGAARASSYMKGAAAYSLAKSNPQNATHEDVMAAALEIMGAGTSGNRFIDEARRKGADWAAEASLDVGKGAGPAGEAYRRYQEELQAYFRPKKERRKARDPETGDPVPDPEVKVPDEKVTSKLVNAVLESDPTLAAKVLKKSGKTKLSDVTAKDALDAFIDLGVADSVYLKMLEPLSFKVAQKSIVDSLEGSRFFKGGYRSYRMVTPTLFVDNKLVKKLGELVGQSATAKDLQKIQASKPVSYGVHKNTSYRLEAGQQTADETPRAGAYIELNESERAVIEDTAQLLANEGFITQAELDAIKYQASPQNLQGANISTSESLRQILQASIISRDNLSRLVNANIERVAFKNKIGADAATFEEATTSTKKALREPLEARHLTQNFFKRNFSRLFGAVKDKKSWSVAYEDGVPLYAVEELDTLRGQLQSMDVTLRRDLEQLVQDKDLQQSYFEPAWLAQNEVTRDDAIVALALGPIVSRTAESAQRALDNIISLVGISQEDKTLDILDVFRQVSVQRSSITSSLTNEGVESLVDTTKTLKERLSNRSPGLDKVNGADDFTDVIGRAIDQLVVIKDNPANIKVPNKELQVASPDRASDITAGFYYLQQQQRLVDEAISNIVGRTPGFEAVKASNELLTGARKIIDEYQTLLAEGFAEIDVAPRVLVEAEEALRGLAAKLEDGTFMGDYTARRVKALLEYRADPSIDMTLYTTDKTDFGKIMGGFFPPEVRDNELITNITARVFAGEDAATRQLFVNTHDKVTSLADEIIRKNNLNTRNLNEGLGVVEKIIQGASDMRKRFVTGGKAPSKTPPIDEEIVQRRLANTNDPGDFVEIISELMLGTPLSKETQKVVNASQQVKVIREALLDLFETDQTLGYKVAKRVDAALSWLTRMRYQAILGSRLAFHTTNVVSAPALVWGTLGGRAALESVQNVPTAMRILSYEPRITGEGATFGVGKRLKEGFGAPSDLRIAVTDPFGRAYTDREVYDMALGSGALRSRTGVTLSPTQFMRIMDDARFMPDYSNAVSKFVDQQLLERGAVGAALGAGVGIPSPTLMGAAGALGAAVLPEGKSLARAAASVDPSRLKASKLGQFLTDMTEWEDQIFRLATVIGALKRGDDPTAALGAGRRSLYDYGDLNAQEKWAMSRFAMFYSFFRLNIANTMQLIVTDPKRFVNIYRGMQGSELIAQKFANEDQIYATNELDFYKHHFLLSRPMIKYVEGADRTTHYQVAPGIPVLDAFSTIARIMMSPVGAGLEELRGFVDPTVKGLTGMKPGFQWRKKYIDPRDMLVLNDTFWGDYLFDVIIGERPKGRAAKAGEETFQGQVWTLSPRALDRYKYYKNTMAPFLTLPGVFTGDTLPLTLLVAPDERLAGRRIDSIGQATGIVRDVGGMPMSEQRLKIMRELTRRIQEIEKQTAPESKLPKKPRKRSR